MASLTIHHHKLWKNFVNHLNDQNFHFKHLKTDLPSYCDVFLEHASEIQNNRYMQGKVIEILTLPECQTLYINPLFQNKVATLLQKANLIDYLTPGDDQSIGGIAAKKNSYGLMHIIYEHQINPTTDYYGRNPLHHACIHGCLETVVFLLTRQWFPINAKDYTQDKRTALHYACKQGYLEIVKLLIENKADIFLTDSNGHSALHIASENGHLEIVKYLLNLEGQKQKIDLRDHHGCTPLLSAASNGHQDVVEYLLENGADINLKDIQWGSEAFKNGENTILHLVCQKKQTDKKAIAFLRVLLNPQFNLDLNAVNNQEQTPFLCALKSGNYHIAKFFIKNFPNLNFSQRDKELCSALHLASEKGYDDIVQFLLKQGLYVNQSTIDGMTPLHYACIGKHPSTIKLLLKNGADPRARNQCGAPPNETLFVSKKIRKSFPKWAGIA